MNKKKILFLGETYRADAITWMNGLKEFGSFEIFTWELLQVGTGLNKAKRAIEMVSRIKELKQKIILLKPDLIIAERVTSYGFIGSLFYKYAPVIIAQQGISDIFPAKGILVPLKNKIQQFAFKHATLIHAWGNAMTPSMLKNKANPEKILVLSKGIDLRNFIYNPVIKDEKIRAIVTRSLGIDYRHETIFKAFEILKNKNIGFELIIIGDGPLMETLKKSAFNKNIATSTIFTGRIDNKLLPQYLANSDLYISMPCSEGVSSSLFEAMACGCYPIVSNLPGNRAWIIEGVNGNLVNVDDVQGLAKALEWYANNRKNLQNLLIKNRETIEQKSSYQKNMETICKKYHQIIENRSCE